MRSSRAQATQHLPVIVTYAHNVNANRKPSGTFLSANTQAAELDSFNSMQPSPKHKIDPHMTQLYWQGFQAICQDSPIDDQMESYLLPYCNLFSAWLGSTVLWVNFCTMGLTSHSQQPLHTESEPVLCHCHRSCMAVPTGLLAPMQPSSTQPPGCAPRGSCPSRTSSTNP